MPQKLENLIKKHVLEKHPWDEEKGKSLVNDFLQLSQVADELNDSNPRAYAIFMQLLFERMNLQNECAERGKRLARLNKPERAIVNKKSNK